MQLRTMLSIVMPRMDNVINVFYSDCATILEYIESREWPQKIEAWTGHSPFYDGAGTAER